MDAKTIIHTMENTGLNNNGKHIEADLQWLKLLLDSRLQSFNEKSRYEPFEEFAPPVFKRPVSVYQKFVESFELNSAERLILILALTPYVAPGLIEKSLQQFGIPNNQFPEIGGVKGSWHGSLIPTGETALYLLAPDNLIERMGYSLYFSPKHKFFTKNILKLEDVSSYEPESSGVITISKEVLSMITTATVFHPLFNSNFPAKLLTTKYQFEDLVLLPETQELLEEISIWLKHKKKLLIDWGFEDKITAGFKCLFYGPSGTGKSLATALIGKQNDLQVYRIDLSMVVSKYIGETEKNLSKIFDTAANKDWILFFDEADALFGKRSNIQNSNDRYANQEVAYLLMRMEEYEGLAILATNLKNNIDKAFLRRFQLIVHFPVPGKAQRKLLWEKSFSPHSVLGKDVDIKSLADNFSLTGSNIISVVRYASTMALKNGTNIITNDNLIKGIKKELAKESGISSDNVN